MKLKLDGNLPHDLATALRRDGHDVHTVVEEQLAGESDPVVVAAATGEGRLLLTLDRGIGDLRRYPPGRHAGVPIARLRYTKSRNLWSLYWRDRNLKFHEYDLADPTPDVRELLDEIDHDPTNIFWG